MILVLPLLFLLAADGKPSVHATATESASVLVEASDADGLDSIDIACAEADSTYHSQLSRAAINRDFHRTFSLGELFPSLKDSKTPVKLEVTVRNIHGAVASATVLISTTTRKDQAQFHASLPQHRHYYIDCSLRAAYRVRREPAAKL